MFKLYLNKGTRTQIDESVNKYDIIKTMGDWLKDDPEERFIVRDANKEKGDTAVSINGLLDYALYVEEYNSELKNMSCVELKRQILQSQDKPKVKCKDTKK